MAFRYADYAIFMKEGAVHAASPVEEVFTEEVIGESCGVPAKLLREYRVVLLG